MINLQDAKNISDKKWKDILELYLSRDHYQLNGSSRFWDLLWSKVISACGFCRLHGYLCDECELHPKYCVGLHRSNCLFWNIAVKVKTHQVHGLKVMITHMIRVINEVEVK